MIIDLRTAIVNRACAALADPRALAIGQAFGLSAGAAWIVTRLEEEPTGLSRVAIRRRLPKSKLAILRNIQAIGPLIDQIRDRVGPDAILTDTDGYRLTPLGRIQIRKALKEPLL